MSGYVETLMLAHPVAHLEGLGHVLGGPLLLAAVVVIVSQTRIGHGEIRIEFYGALVEICRRYFFTTIAQSIGLTEELQCFKR